MAYPLSALERDTFLPAADAAPNSCTRNALNIGELLQRFPLQWPEKNVQNIEKHKIQPKAPRLDLSNSG